MPAPTAEQQKIVEAARTETDGVVQARAGTGKTTTLVLCAEDRPDKTFLYLAYNKRLQVEASTKFPQNTDCRTAHSLAYRATMQRKDGKRLMGRLRQRRLSAREAAAILKLAPFSFQMPNEAGEMVEMTRSPRQIAVILKRAMKRFYNSADTEPSVFHFEYEAMTKGATGPRDDANYKAFTQRYLPALQAYWADIQDPNGQLHFEHDSYLKMWSLTDPQLPVDGIFFDEAQDANPCISHVVEIQTNAQCIMVGDTAQAIYGWRGAVDAMQSFKSDWTLYLTQSFRFGDAVAEQANRWLVFTAETVDPETFVKGFDKIESKVETTDLPNCVLCRTNAGTIESAMRYQEAGKKVAITGGTKEIEAFMYAANDLMQSKGTDHPDLGAYRDWSEVQAAVKSGEAEDLGMLVRLTDNYGTHAILEVCRASNKPEEADIEISTAHKAKGSEWDHVQIHSDFKAPAEGKVSKTEAMLIYVAVTRAKLVLDNSNLSWLDEVEREEIEDAIQDAPESV